MSLRNSGSSLTEGMKVHEDLIPSLSRVDIVDREVKVVGSDGALSTLVHQYLRNELIK